MQWFQDRNTILWERVSSIMPTIVSIFASASRPENWQKVVESIVTNLDYEIVFCGPKPPKNHLAENFTFIKSKAKPVQCFEIAFRSCVGKYAMSWADDCILGEPYAIDKLVEKFEENVHPFNIVSLRYSQDSVVQPTMVHRYDVSDVNSPIMPCAGLFLRESLIELGGIDSRFIAVNWDLDLAMRFYEKKGKVLFTDNHINEVSEMRRGSKLWFQFHQSDRALLDSLWKFHGEICEVRKDSVRKFPEQISNTRSVNPRGKWRGEGLIVFEKIQDLMAVIKNWLLHSTFCVSCYQLFILPIRNRRRGLRI